MGGRGASSGISDYGNKYGSQYRTLYQDGNIKFVQKNSRTSETLMETMTQKGGYMLRLAATTCYKSCTLIRT